jgi:hypothetical protein
MQKWKNFKEQLDSDDDVDDQERLLGCIIAEEDGTQVSKTL